MRTTSQSNERWAFSWSGGKDSTKALYKCLRKGLNISHLVTIVKVNGESIQHHIPVSVIEKQAELLGKELVLIPTIINNYYLYMFGLFKELNKLKENGLTGCIFGDIDQEWRKTDVTNRCESIGIKGYFPLWGADKENLVEEFVRDDFKAIITAVNLKMSGTSDLLGKPLNMNTIALMKENGIDPCGENGEYHSVVTGGPIFNGEITFSDLQPRYSFVENCKYLLLKC